ncbi:hypothetical protein ES731_00225 [Psychroflexus gondwanensis]|nr:hypothetical protein ES731_00225 [Psychroflexus gondwanensis]
MKIRKNALIKIINSKLTKKKDLLDGNVKFLSIKKAPINDRSFYILKTFLFKLSFNLISQLSASRIDILSSRMS